MKKSQLMSIMLISTIVFLAAAVSTAQTPASQQPAPAVELYHIHFAKAAPGKLPQLVEAYKNSPAPAANEPQFRPIILRHREGSEWDFLTITPLGRQVTISAEAPSQAIQDYFERVAALTDSHDDTFAVGPSWAAVQKALLADKGEPVYIVSDYRASPGHRSQLRQVLNRGAQDTPDRSVLFAHVEGAPWNFLSITRYESWAAMGAPPPQPSAGTAPQDQGLAMREHLAVHHDTIAVFVSGGQAIPK